MRWLSIGIRVGLAVLAAWALRRELSGLDVGDVLRELQRNGAWHATLALALTALSFLLLGAIELLALRYAERTVVSRWRGITTGFVAHALSQSIGVALLTGASVRTQAYRRSLSAADVARVTAFVTLTVTLGLLATGAAAFIASSAPLHLWHLSLAVRPVGVALGATVVAYLAWCASRGHAATVTRWRIARPGPAVAMSQIALASLDWVVTGSILYFALPVAAGVDYGTALRVYLVAQTVGSLSHVPGGAGVFELLVLALLAPVTTGTERAAVVAALVLFRVVYYLVPLVAALLVAAATMLKTRAAVAHAR